MSDHDELASLVAPWVLGALDPTEAEAVEMHVQACASCREDARRLRGVVSALPLAVEEIKPPARLRERVLAAAAASGSAAPAVARRRESSPKLARPRILVRLSRLNRVPVYAVAAALVLALLAGIALGEVTGRQNPPQVTPQVARYTLTGHNQLAGARAIVIDLKSDGLALVDFSGLPSLPSGKVYEVWLIGKGGQVDAATVFVPDPNGGRVVLVNRPLAGYTQMAVTTEVGPDGVQAPTQQPQLYGNLA
jgi:anti-sigma-K factor RskA